MAEDEGYNTQSPLADVVLCCTSIPPEKRTELAAVASQMGAVHKLDLTSDVTHLIVGDSDTPKYKYVARERPDVKVLGLEWVEAVRVSWMAGGETDVGALEDQYRLPTFAGLRICVTGFEDLVERERLMNVIVANGASYDGDLTKRVTHLIARGTRSKKYEYAKVWGQKIVSLEWLDDCLERGMILDENLYHLDLPQEERGRNAWIRQTVALTIAGKRPREEGQSQVGSDVNRRKLRRTASARLGSQNEDLWDDIVGGVMPAKRRKSTEWKESHERKGNEGVAPSVTTKQVDVERSDTMDRRFPEQENPSAKKTVSGILPKANTTTNRGIFEGRKFFVHGFDERQHSILQHHLKSHDGEIASTLSDLQWAIPSAEGEIPNNYLVIPHTLDMTRVSQLLSEECQVTTVTEWWVERCLHKKILVHPLAHVANTPLREFPIPGFNRTIICSTAFSGVDLLHVSKVVKLIGATYDEYLTSNASVLVSNSVLPSKEKERHAREWDVPIVTADWLWDSIASSQKKPFNDYLISAIAQLPRPSTVTSEATTGSAATVDKAQLPKRYLSGKALGPVRARLSEQPKEALQSVKATVDSKSLHSSAKVKIHGDGPPKSENDARALSNEPASPHDEDDLAESHTLTRDVTPSPLQDIDPEVNSPKKRTSRSTSKEEPSAAAPPSPPPPSGPRTDTTSTSKPLSDSDSQQDSLNSHIASLLAHKHATNVLNRPSTTNELHPARRKRTLLGRAPSNVSNGSTSLSRANSVDSAAVGGTDTDRIRAGGDETPVPSQALSYDDPEVQKQRERMERKMSGAVKPGAEGMVGKGSKAVLEERPRSIGVVRDSVADGMLGVAGRVKRGTPRRVREK
ncbi:MAG: hypothetical protein M1827_001409 [Pycnora praestabilis]|nr:MAG: hypothetical protein M1827_001409 [Pycnora praestabilis]